MKIINNTIESSSEVKSWNGYTLAELRYRLDVVATRRDIEKERMKLSLTSIAKENVTVKSGVNILKRMVGALNIMDYAILAFKMGLRLRSLYRNLKE